MICHECKYGLCRLVGIEGDEEFWSATCIIDGEEITIEILNCNQFERKSKWDKLIHFWDTQ